MRVCLYNTEGDGQRQSEVFRESNSIIVKNADKATAQARIQAISHMNTDTWLYVTLKYKQDCSCSSVALSDVATSSIKMGL